MSQYAAPLVFALLLWWFSTGVIIYLDNLPPRTFRWTMLGATALAGVGLYGLGATAGDMSVSGAYTAFASALAVWAWHEVSFYTGIVTGPRRHACAQGCRGWRHFGHALMSSLYHELAILASGALLVWQTHGAANQVGLWTFLVLWWMHESARLNVFLGVPNITQSFLPPHLDFLRGFLTRRPMNLLFPVSVTASTVVATLLVQRAASADGGAATGLTLVAAMLGLAILEHWFLVLPLPVEALWAWSLRARDRVRRPARLRRVGELPAETNTVA